MAEKEKPWFERDTKSVAQEGIERTARTNWRKVTITSDPLNGDIVLEYGHPTGEPDVRRYSPKQCVLDAANLMRLIGAHVTP